MNYKLNAVVTQLMAIWSAAGGNIAKLPALIGGKHRSFTDRCRKRLVKAREMLVSYTLERDEVRQSILQNNACRPEVTINKKKSAIQWLTIVLCPPLIVVFTVAAIVTYAVYIKENSMDGSVAGAIGVSLSVWAFSPALKYFLGGALAAWKRLLEILMFGGLILAFGVLVWEVTENFMIWEEAPAEVAATPNPFEDSPDPAPETSAAPAKVSYRNLYFALSIVEAIGVFALASALANALRPERDEMEIAADGHNGKLRRRERYLSLTIGRLRAEIEVLEERERNAKAVPDAVQAIIKKLID